MLNIKVLLLVTTFTFLKEQRTTFTFFVGWSNFLKWLYNETFDGFLCDFTAQGVFDNHNNIA